MYVKADTHKQDVDTYKLHICARKRTNLKFRKVTVPNKHIYIGVEQQYFRYFEFACIQELHAFDISADQQKQKGISHKLREGSYNLEWTKVETIDL